MKTHKLISPFIQSIKIENSFQLLFQNLNFVIVTVVFFVRGPPANLRH